MSLTSDFVAITYDSFATILVTRFLVRLQEAARPVTGSECLRSGTLAGTGTLQFARADVDSWARELGPEQSPGTEVAMDG